MTKEDEEAIKLARREFERRDPTERESFRTYLGMTYDHLRAKKFPGEYSDPFAE